MPFQNVAYPKKKEVPNRFKKKPVLSFKPNKEIFIFLNKLKNKKEMSQFINKSISRNILFSDNHEYILRELIQENPILARHLLRKELRKRSLEEQRDHRTKIKNKMISNIKEHYPELKNGHSYFGLASEYSKKFPMPLNEFMQVKGY